MPLTSPHFSFAELTRTDLRYVSNVPSEEQAKRLVVLAHDFLEPLRAQFGPLRIHSGFRSLTVNGIIGGSPTSAHPHGAAADLSAIRPEVTIEEMARWLRASTLPVDQVIDERGLGAGWLHVGMALPWINSGVPRREFLTMRLGRHPLYQPLPE